MVKHFIAAEIIDHRLVNMPHLMAVQGRPSTSRSLINAIEPMRGMAIAAILSAMLWMILIAAIA